MKYIALIFILLLIVAIGGSYYMFCFACDNQFRPIGKKKRLNMGNKSAFDKLREELKCEREVLLARPHEDVSITSADGLKLHGDFFPCENPERIVVCVHGYKGFGIKDMAMVANFYLDNNCHVLLIDQRACGKSEGRYITFGMKESLDLARWLDMVDERFFKLPIFIDGVSMGATTAMLALGLALPKNVRGVISDCGFTSQWDICKHILKRNFHLPAFPVLYITNLICRIKLGYDMRTPDTRRAFENARVPIVFVHGAEDDFVPVEMGRYNYGIYKGEKDWLCVEGAGHGLSYTTDKQKCQQGLLSFFRKYENM
ncbi:MAG: alpha/beta hydrolase [Clostridia bacterium]|nr:alpha/beta hydrolase [Clostridia bacterium]